MAALRCLDFEKMGFPTGLLVERSAHHQTDRCKKGRPQLGIVTGFKVYEDDERCPVVWPVVAWEGCATGPTTVNPALVDVHRAKDRKRAHYVERAV